MIKVAVNQKKVVVKVKGEPKDLLKDMMFIEHAVFKAVREKDEASAIAYARTRCDSFDIPELTDIMFPGVDLETPEEDKMRIKKIASLFSKDT